jgi:hypothetical protein
VPAVVGMDHNRRLALQPRADKRVQHLPAVQLWAKFRTV